MRQYWLIYPGSNIMIKNRLLTNSGYFYCNRRYCNTIYTPTEIPLFLFRWNVLRHKPHYVWEKSSSSWFNTEHFSRLILFMKCSWWCYWHTQKLSETISMCITIDQRLKCSFRPYTNNLSTFVTVYFPFFFFKCLMVQVWCEHVLLHFGKRLARQRLTPKHKKQDRRKLKCNYWETGWVPWK